MLHIGTRFFGKDREKDFSRIRNFLEKATLLGTVHVAVNVEEDTIDTLTFVQENFPEVDAFGVRPWGKFVFPLNTIVSRATVLGADRLLLASAEFPPLEEQTNVLLGHIDNDTLVAGARFSDHEFKEGNNVGTGVTIPWNTFAVWNLRLLARVGFPLLGDAPFDTAKAGVEEVCTISILQKLCGASSAKAKLVSIEGFYEVWNTAGWDAERLVKHHAKILSKNSRPQAQLEWARLVAPTVEHIA